MNKMKKYASFDEAIKHFSDAYHAKNVKVAFTLKVNYVLLTSRTLKEHVEEIAEVKRSQNITNNDMLTESKIKAHLKFLEERNFVIEKKNDKYRIADYISDMSKTISLKPGHKSRKEKSDYDGKQDISRIIRDNMKNIYDFFESKGFFFSREVLTRYFLSLKTKPFVILTGISGTGKTKIAQIFADYICQNDKKDEKEKRIAFISVRPDWMDNKGLLGFYNILDETYHETPLLNLILEAGNNPDLPYFVILDEMNLSKVEQYFSDFLSIMESRTSDKMIGEPLFLHFLDNVKTLSGNEIPGKIYIPENIYFTGTVNVDETTYMFSPKVLDRANVIEFNEVDLEGYESGSGKDYQFCLANPDVTNELLSREIEPFCSKQDFIKLKEIIKNKYNFFEELLTCLKKYNLHFGYRVINEISRFVWISKDFMGNHFEINEAFDIQILQKILPKFHGTQGKLEEPLKDLLYLCYGHTDRQENVSDDMIQKAEGFDEGAKYPRSAKKIARMLKNIKNQGYTSFIE